MSDITYPAEAVYPTLYKPTLGLGPGSYTSAVTTKAVDGAEGGAASLKPEAVDGAGGDAPILKPVWPSPRPGLLV